MKTVIGLTEFTLKAMTLSARPTKSRWAMMKNLMKRASSHKDHFPNTLFTLSRCRITEDDGSGDLLSQSQMHIDKRDEEVLAVQQRMRWRPRCVGRSWLFCVTTSMAASRIYREDPPRVTVSLNRLGLFLSKYIRYGLIAKINGKRKSRTCEALGWISTDYSHTRCAPTPIASPHHAPPRSARREQPTL
jgi:hypothetical protein